MANIQKQLVQFDEKIRLTRFGENKMLREKRDIILRKLESHFKALRATGERIPTFEPLNQGSYEMGTGIQPALGDYDIDVGLRFWCSKDDYYNPVRLKVLVADALEGHTSQPPRIRRSCVTVYYKLGGEQAYHVDLAVYAYDDPESASRELYIAKGLRDADADNRWWEPSDPLGLAAWVEGRFQDADASAQFLRVIRALKRWKTEKFKRDGDNAPSGIGLTVAARNWFQPRFTRDSTANTTTFDDLEAMRTFAETMAGHFRPVAPSPSGAERYRLKVPLPVAPYKDIFEKMDDGPMTTFRERLLQLRELLDEVKSQVNPVTACELMRKHFCEEFPVPDKDDTGQGRGRAIASGGISA